MITLETPVEYVKGIGPQRATLLKAELDVSTVGDLLQYFPFRYEDRTKYLQVAELTEEMPNVLVRGVLTKKELVGHGRTKLVATLKDASGEIELVWFKGINWINPKLTPGTLEYSVFGKPTRYGHRLNMAHPEIEAYSVASQASGLFFPVYSVTEKMRRKYVDNRWLSRIIREIVELKTSIPETLPEAILRKHRLMAREEAIRVIHYPKDLGELAKAQQRLKFEELFFLQLKMLRTKHARQQKFKGQKFESADLVTRFYQNHMPFELTNAQKKVIREIYQDLRSGIQMNRLLQGDVGSGKTIVAFITMLLIIAGNAQCVLMAPTEILAQQHFAGLMRFANVMDLSIDLLTGSVKRSARKGIHDRLRSGELNILVGTHALLEDEVLFHNLGIAIIDEQHRFGVAQRSRLWHKSANYFPHVLVMTATPIPRTLCMTLYGDLDVSVIDELPKGRKPVKTIHKFDSHRLEVNQFIRNEIASGRQVYVVYPLIEESEKLDLKHLMDGYESITRAFPDTPVSILHGRMPADAKEFEMNRFTRNETKIMVATTVIEVGVDVPNASVMVIENAERFGLSQLHQLRGRVGRGADQSYCVLMTGHKLGTEARTRIETMVQTNDGFKIAETDLKLRGPGDMSGTQQSGVLDLKLADLSKDGPILKAARDAVISLLESDPDLVNVENQAVKMQLEKQRKGAPNWSRIG
jgi:ATP-dependent DNA helicase RecG